MLFFSYIYDYKVLCKVNQIPKRPICTWLKLYLILKDAILERTDKQVSYSDFNNA